jgi:hypothetical protein
VSTGSLLVVVVAALLALAPLVAGPRRAARVLQTCERVVVGVGVLALRVLLLPPSPVLTAMSFLVAGSAAGAAYAVAVLARRTPGRDAHPSVAVTGALIAAAVAALGAGAYAGQVAGREQPAALAAWQALERDTLQPVSVDPVDPGQTHGPCAALTGTGKCVLLVDGQQCLVIDAEAHPTFLKGDSDPHYKCADVAVARVPGTPQQLAFPRGEAVRFLDGDHLGATLTRASLHLGPPLPWLLLAAAGLLFGAGTVVWARGRPDGDLRVRHARLVLIASALPALLAVLVRLVLHPP